MLSADRSRALRDVARLWTRHICLRLSVSLRRRRSASLPIPATSITVKLPLGFMRGSIRTRFRAMMKLGCFRHRSFRHSGIQSMVASEREERLNAVPILDAYRLLSFCHPKVCTMLKGFSPIVTAPPHICFVPPTRLSVFETPSPMRAPLTQILGCVDLALPRLIREFLECLLPIPSR